MFETSHIEISKSALKNNLAFIREQIGNDIKLSSVVKGNAYGHSIEKFVPLAEKLGIDHFSVFAANEAYEVLNSRKNEYSKIMIMGMITNNELEWAIKNKVEFYVFEPDRLQAAVRIAEKLGTPAHVHVNVETGMNRIGFEKNQIDEVIKFLKSDNIEFVGLCTHFAGAESIANYFRVRNQMIKFRKMKKSFKREGLIPKYFHCASSAATMNYPKARFNMVRVGILQYGLWPSSETLIHYLSKQKSRKNPLRRIISWKSSVMNTKKVKVGQFVGYSNFYLAQDDVQIAVIPVGYANGYSRSLSNQGSVIINGYKAKVIGIVNMNMLIVDITDIPKVNKGDEVILIGSQGQQEITISAFGESTDQMNYESLARLPKSIPRKIVN